MNDVLPHFALQNEAKRRSFKITFGGASRQMKSQGLFTQPRKDILNGGCVKGLAEALWRLTPEEYFFKTSVLMVLLCKTIKTDVLKKYSFAAEGGKRLFGQPIQKILYIPGF